MKQENEKFEKYKEYARDITEGRIKSNKYIQFVCNRFLSFFEREDLYFDIDTINKFFSFVDKLRLFDRNNEKVVLLPFQIFIICNLFGFKYKSNNKRVCTESILFIPRKNAKSTLVAIVNLFLLITEPQNSQIVIGAGTAKQAKIMFEMCQKFLLNIDKNQRYFKVFRDNINFNGTKLFIVSSNASKLDGYGCIYTLDEFSNQTNSSLDDVLASSQIALPQPFKFYTTTANFNRFNYGYEKIETYFKMIDNKTLPLEICPFLYCLDNEEEATIENKSEWIKANPSLNNIVQENYLIKEIEKLKIQPSNKNNILIKHFNLYVTNDKENNWLDLEVIKNHSQKLDINNFLNDEKYILSVGFDLSVSRDLTSVSYNFIDIETNKNYIFTQSYLPISEYTEQNKNYSLYQRAVREKSLNLINSNVIDYKVVLQDMLNIFEKKRPLKIYYDSYNAHSLILDLMENGYSDDVLTPLSQSILQFNKITKEFERNLLTSDNIILNTSILTSFAFNNCGLLYDNNNNCKPVKKSYLQSRQKNGSDKIDPVISILQSFNYVLEQQENFFTIGN